MKHTRKNIFFHELIGLEICILEHSDPSLVSVCGTIVDETAKTIVIETKKGVRKRVYKEHGVYAIWLPNREKVIIRGNQILGRPEDRLKKMLK